MGVVNINKHSVINGHSLGNKSETSAIPLSEMIINDSTSTTTTSAIKHNNCINSNSTTSTSKSTPQHSYLGIGCALLGSMFMSLMSFCALLLHGHHPFVLAMWRFTGNTIPAIPILIYLVVWKKQNIFNEIHTDDEMKKINFTIIFGILGVGVIYGLAASSRFTAQTFISFADTSVITKCTPIVVFLLAYLILHEIFTIVGGIAVICTISGLFTLSRPPLLTGQAQFELNNLIGIGFASTATILVAISIIFMRKLRKIHFALMSFGMGLGGMTITFILAASFQVLSLPTNLRDIMLTASLMILSFLGHSLAILALKYEEAGTISIVNLSNVLFAFLWQIVFLQNQFPDAYSILGALVIMSGLLLISLRKWIQGKEENSKIRSRLSFLLK